jgi:carbon-monoxide dehydrogenase medium subunit
MRTLRPFEYFEPGTVKEAVKLLSTYSEKAQVLAGGIDLIPRMRKGMIKADYLVNIQKIPSLEAIEANGAKGLKFGAMAKLHAMETSKAVQKDYPVLYEAIHQIASVQAKYMGTAVGNLCVATPASDVATALFALDAELTIAGVDGERTEPIEAFYIDYHHTSLQRGEMVTGVYLPSPPPGTGTAYLNLVRTHADIAKVGVAVTIIVEDGLCKDAKIAIGAAAPTVVRATKAEAVLKDQKVNAQAISQAAETAAGETKPITDLRSTAEYRKEMTRVLVGRALEKALERAKA